MDGIVFDMDGVLIDTERLYKECWTAAAAECGMDFKLAEELVHRCIGLSFADTKRLCEKMFSEAGFSETGNGERFKYETFAGRAKELFAAKAEEGIPVKEGAYVLLEYLKANHIPAALASSTSYHTIIKELAQLNLDGYFQVIIGGDMVDRGKPAPDIYLKAVSEMKLAPERVIAIEDSPNGLKAAKAAGLKTIMVPDILPYTEELRPYVDELFTSLKSVQEALGKGELMGGIL